MSDALFHKADLRNALAGYQQQMIDEINGMEPDYLLNVSTDAVREYLENKYQVNVPVLHEDSITSDLQDHWQISRDTFDGREYRQPSTMYLFYVPYDGDSELFKLRPSTYTFNPPHAEVKTNELVFAYARALGGLDGRNQEEAESVRKNFLTELESVKEYLRAIQQDINAFHPSLFEKARIQIEFRKAKFLQDRGVGAALGFPLRKRENAPDTYKPPSVRRKSPVRPIASKPMAQEPPPLQTEEYDQILATINSMVMVIERSPKAFATMNEEDLRQHFLVQLNSQYEGQATGETFNFEGKTDILIRADGKNIFIAECKFWKGPKLFTETIDQILGYTSWRDTKTAIILFNRNKNFSAVLKTIPEVVTQHPNYRRTLSKPSETEFRYVFTHRDDSNRELLLSVLAFEVPE